MDPAFPLPVGIPSPVCACTLRVHAFHLYQESNVRCLDCGLSMPLNAFMRDGPDARHCVACGWWSPEADCLGAGWCVWCKTPFDDA
jgi:hypothetical protein